MDLASPHGADPVEHLDSGWHGNQKTHDGEERQEHRSRGEHVVCPDAKRKSRDGEGGKDHASVTKDRLLREDGEDFCHDSKEWQGENINLRVSPEPEDVLPKEWHPTTLHGVDMRAEVAVAVQHDQAGGENWERKQNQNTGHQHVPGEDWHPEEGHARSSKIKNSGDQVDPRKDGGEPGE